MTACVGLPKKALSEAMGQETTAVGLIKVRPSGEYSRGYETQLRFFHLLNIDTRERFRVDIQSVGKAVFLALDPGAYEVIRVQINEGPMMMESHVSLKFQVRPNKTTYLGTWQFDVDTPRTQRMLRMEITHEKPMGDEFSTLHQYRMLDNMVVSPADPQGKEVRLFTVAPLPKISYYYR